MLHQSTNVPSITSRREALLGIGDLIKLSIRGFASHNDTKNVLVMPTVQLGLARRTPEKPRIEKLAELGYGTRNADISSVSRLPGPDLLSGNTAQAISSNDAGTLASQLARQAADDESRAVSGVVTLLSIRSGSAGPAVRAK
jgi:hypothetical protein